MYVVYVILKYTIHDQHKLQKPPKSHAEVTAELERIKTRRNNLRHKEDGSSSSTAQPEASERLV